VIAAGGSESCSIERTGHLGAADDDRGVAVAAGDALDEVHALKSDESVAQRCDERPAVDHASAHDVDDEELLGQELLYPLDVARHQRV
jgi:hypothetical protein